MLVSDPLLQVAPKRFLIGEAAKDHLANAKPDITMSAAGIQPASSSTKVISPISIAIREMTNLAS